MSKALRSALASASVFAVVTMTTSMPRVEASARYAAKIANPRECHGDQAIEELVHPLAAQRHLASDRHALAQLEGCDRPLCFGDDRMLAGDCGQIGGCRL